MHPPHPCDSPKRASTSTPRSIDELEEEVLLGGDVVSLLVSDDPNPFLANPFLESLAFIRRTCNKTHPGQGRDGAQSKTADKPGYQRRASHVPLSVKQHAVSNVDIQRELKQRCVDDACTCYVDTLLVDRGS